MSEKNTKQSAENESNKSNKNTKGETNKVVSITPKVTKAKWTLERCKRYARRFPNENVWSASSPSSYKAAVAHGWLSQCVAQYRSGSNSSSYKKAA